MARRKKPSGREAGAARRAVHDGPYWFDRARSLAELHGWPAPNAGDGRGLVGRYAAAVTKPVGRLDEADLELLFAQHADPHFLAPVALDLAHGGALAGRAGGLVGCLVRLGDAFWRDRPYLLARLVETIEAGRERLAEGDRDGELVAEADAFVRRHRAR